jgi:hypothetical protein
MARLRQPAVDDADATRELMTLSLLRVAAAEPGTPADLAARRFADAAASVALDLPPVERLREMWAVIDRLGMRERAERHFASLRRAT